MFASNVLQCDIHSIKLQIIVCKIRDLWMAKNYQVWASFFFFFKELLNYNTRQYKYNILIETQIIMLTMKTCPWIVSMQRPAPGGKVRSAHADTETISGMSTPMVLLSIFTASPDLPERLCADCFCSILLIWWEEKQEKKMKNKERTILKYKCTIVFFFFDRS